MSNWAYYNEIDPFAAQWLRNLIDNNLIAPGVVDERSIEDVTPEELREFTQCHFFAGVGVWSYALRQAGWPDDRPAWTGSCPCQPFAAPGKRKGFADERHLWPAWFHLIQQRRPGVVFGEQVASKDGLGWLDLVQSDLEGAGYTNAAVDLCAAGVGAPHIRQRLWFVAHPDSERCGRQQVFNQSWQENFEAGRGCGSGQLADTEGERRLWGQSSAWTPGRIGPEKRGIVGGFWNNADWIDCIDGKARAVEPGTFPLVDGYPGRVGQLRAYGNAINAEVAKEFIAAYKSGLIAA